MKRPNNYEIHSKIIQALLFDEILNIEAIKKATGLSRPRIVSNLPQIREELRTAHFCYAKVLKSEGR
jgi:hypothetical protein